MNPQSNKAPAHPLVLIAFFSSMASVGIVALAFCLLREISGAGMWAIAAMAAAPSAMGITMAFFLTKRPQRSASILD